MPLSAPKWNDSQPGGSITVSDSGELVTSDPATVRVTACWPELAAGDEVVADDGATEAGGAADVGAVAADAGAVAAGLQAALDTTIAAVPTTNLKMLFTDRALHRATANPALPPAMSPEPLKSFHLARMERFGGRLDS